MLPRGVQASLLLHLALDGGSRGRPGTLEEKGVHGLGRRACQPLSPAAQPTLIQDGGTGPEAGAMVLEDVPGVGVLDGPASVSLKLRGWPCPPFRCLSWLLLSNWWRGGYQLESGLDVCSGRLVGCCLHLTG